jgi:SAM-dependent methyltransferase/uncharacterized protein YbaR (Trm112 family)
MQTAFQPRGPKRIRTVRESLLKILRCPVCRAADWSVDAQQRDGEILEGRLLCGGCKRAFALSRGAVDLVPDEMLTDIQRRDRETCAESDRRIAEEKRRGEFIGEVRAREDEYQAATAARTDFLFHEIEYDDPGRRWVLDLGCGEPLLANRFARLGFNVIALDFVTTRLDSAHEMFERDGTYFERLAGLMARLPLADDSIDIVFSHASLHHATPLAAEDFRWCDPRNMLDTLREVRRVLKPDGMFLVSGEGEYSEEIADDDRELERTAQETGAYEAFYKRSEYEWAFRETDLWPDVWAQYLDGRLRVSTFKDARHREVVTGGDSVAPRSNYLLRAPALARDLTFCLSDWARVRPWPDGGPLLRSGGPIDPRDAAIYQEGWQPIEADTESRFRWLGRDRAVLTFALDYVPGDWRLEFDVEAFSMLGEFDSAVFFEREGRVVRRHVLPRAPDPVDRRQSFSVDLDPEADADGVRCVADGQMRLHVFFNGDFLATLAPPADTKFHSQTLVLPAPRVRRLNQIVFEPAYALRPSDCAGVDDDRWLSCAVRDVQIQWVEPE